MGAKQNVGLKLMDRAMLRTPFFAMDAELAACWPELKLLIRDASPAFYEVIEKMSFEELASASDKIYYSVWKYFNRARFRATPFGRFAAVSIVGIGPSRLILEKRLRVRRFNDWSEKDGLLTGAKQLVRETNWFISNATYYVVGNEIRYIRYDDRGFELAAIEYSPQILLILDFCKKKLGKGALMHYATTSVVTQLVDCQLLLTERFPNITGEDYFKRLNIPEKNEGLHYIISERKTLDGGVDAAGLLHLPDFLDFMNGFLLPNESGHLSQFKNAFRKRFDRKAVPLAVALDPETGVGYGGMAQNLQEAELGEILENYGKTKTRDAQITYGPQLQFLLNGLIRGGTIELDEFPKQPKTIRLPNTCSVLLHYWNGTPVIESMGGCTANALLGRFSIAIEKVHQLGKEIADMEGKANPGVLFFDVAYQAEKHVDNVNRRQLLYPAELPILSWSTHSETLTVHDILVAVRNDEIVMWSKNNGKRMVPRIASAYNYTRSDLALYRFMCDLQHHGLQTNLNFNIRQLLPGIEHYPQIRFKNLIVSPAMWRLGKASWANMAELEKWLSDKTIDFQFRCGSADQTLCFDPAKNDDLNAFLHYRRQNPGEDVYIEEALIGGEGNAADEQGNRYMTQYVANYYNEDPIYKAYPVPETADLNDTFLAGGEWLYAEIYCHSSRSDELLTQPIRKFIFGQKAKIEKWFFIRYDEGGPHIRLRLLAKDHEGLMAALRLELEPYCRVGLISDIQVKTYFRETERYRQIELAEYFFHYDSIYVLRLLRKGGDTTSFYCATVGLMDRLCCLAFEDEWERLSFVRKMADSFSQEFSLSRADLKRINARFEKLKNDLNTAELPRSYEAAFQKCYMVAVLPDLIHMHVNRVFHSGQRAHEAVLYQYLLKLMLSRGFRTKGAREPELTL